MKRHVTYLNIYSLSITAFEGSKNMAGSFEHTESAFFTQSLPHTNFLWFIICGVHCHTRHSKVSSNDVIFFSYLIFLLDVCLSVFLNTFQNLTTIVNREICRRMYKDVISFALITTASKTFLYCSPAPTESMLV